MALRISDEDYEKEHPELNPGQEDYNQKFNGLNKAEEKGNADNNPSSSDSDLDKIKNNEENPDDSFKDKFTPEREADLRKGLNQKGAAMTRLGKWKGTLMKKGPLASILLILGGGGIMMFATLSPALILSHIGETLMDKLNYGRPALMIRTNANLYSKFKSAKFTFDKSTDTKCSIRCKFGTMNSTMKANLEAKGFKLDVNEGQGVFKNRFTVNSMTFPDTGKTVSNTKEFTEAMKNNTNASSFKRVFDSKAAYFLNSKFGQVLYKKFGLDKLAKIKSNVTEKINGKIASAKESAKAGFRKALNLPDIDVKAPKMTILDKINANPKMAPLTKFLGSAGSIGIKAGGVVNAICGAFSLGKGFTYAAKAAKIGAIVGFGMVILNEWGKIQAGEETDPAVMETIGDTLTTPDENGLTATDSKAYKTAAYGDTVPLDPYDKVYSGQTSDSFLGAATQSWRNLAFLVCLLATASCGRSFFPSSLPVQPMVRSLNYGFRPNRQFPQAFVLHQLLLYVLRGLRHRLSGVLLRQHRRCSPGRCGWLHPVLD